MASEQQPAPLQTPPEERCNICGSVIPRLGNYCPNCGSVKPSMAYSGIPAAGDRRTWTGYPVYYQPVPRRSTWRIRMKAICAFVMVTFIIYLVIELVTLVWGTQYVIPDIIDTWHGYALFIVMPFVIDIFELSGYPLVLYYLFLIAAIIASCLWVIITSMPMFSKELTMRAPSRQHSALFETVGLLFATMCFSVVVALLSSTSSEDVPDIPTMSESLFLLANASVWEELIARVLLIGIPLLLIDLVRRKRAAKWHSYILGGGFKMGVAEVALILISSVIFGFAHFVSGWGAWKILPAATAGLAFGFLFLRFGLAASIMLHFATDYLSLPYEVFDSMSLQIVTGLGLILWLVFGGVFFFYYTVRVAEFFTNQRFLEQKPVPEATGWVGPVGQTAQPPQYQYVQGGTQQPYALVNPPQQYQYPSQAPRPPPPPSNGIGGGYVCLVCGNTEARWVDGRFQCLRCGSLS